MAERMTWLDVERHNKRVTEKRLGTNGVLIPNDRPKNEGVSIERDLHDDIEAELRRRRTLYIHSRMDKATTTALGVPDFCIYPPNSKAFFVECKTKTGKLTPEQQGFKLVAEIAGYRFEVVRSMDDFMKIVDL